MKMTTYSVACVRKFRPEKHKDEVVLPWEFGRVIDIIAERNGQDPQELFNEAINAVILRWHEAGDLEAKLNGGLDADARYCEAEGVNPGELIFRRIQARSRRNLKRLLDEPWSTSL